MSVPNQLGCIKNTSGYSPAFMSAFKKFIASGGKSVNNSSTYNQLKAKPECQTRCSDLVGIPTSASNTKACCMMEGDSNGRCDGFTASSSSNAVPAYMKYVDWGGDDTGVKISTCTGGIGCNHCIYMNKDLPTKPTDGKCHDSAGSPDAWYPWVDPLTGKAAIQPKPPTPPPGGKPKPDACTGKKGDALKTCCTGKDGKSTTNLGLTSCAAFKPAADSDPTIFTIGNVNIKQSQIPLLIGGGVVALLVLYILYSLVMPRKRVQFAQ